MHRSLGSRRFLASFVFVAVLAVAGILASSSDARAQVLGVFCGGKAGLTAEGKYGCNGLCANPLKVCCPVYSNRKDKNGQVKPPVCRCLWAITIIIVTTDAETTTS